MSYAFQGISTLSSALEAFQTQMNITGENIANVNTPGYSRQNVVLNESPGAPTTWGSTFLVGGGVTVQSVNRIRDMYLQGSSVRSSSDLGKASTQADQMNAVGSVMFDPSSGGISGDISAFFNSWSSLATNPSSSTQLGVQQAAQALTDDFRNTYSSLDSIKNSASQQVDGVIKQIQGDVDQIAKLNQEILKANTSGGEASTLLDQRDQAVQDLSSKINVTVAHNQDGSYVIQAGNLTLVDQSGSRQVPTEWDSTTGSLIDSQGNSHPVSSGQLSGLLDSINKVSGYESSLDGLATQIRTSVNALYGTAADASGTTGAAFFTGTGAADFDLDPGVQGDPTKIAFGTSGAASDAGVAQQIADLSSQKMSALGNQTISDSYSTLVGRIGADGQTATNSQATQTAISQQIQSQIQSVSGVNLDEEMSNLLRFQSSYQAAAQALNAVNQTTQTLLSMVQF
ncbi:MAG TPA: flagellar hook-associated protein FlgK [Fimbriimonas sp.]|nr:flagellar hook-associated protein FlgK [Fimbriimonas sp.]